MFFSCSHCRVGVYEPYCQWFNSRFLLPYVKMSLTQQNPVVAPSSHMWQLCINNFFCYLLLFVTDNRKNIYRSTEEVEAQPFYIFMLIYSSLI